MQWKLQSKRLSLLEDSNHNRDKKEQQRYSNQFKGQATQPTLAEDSNNNSDKTSEEKKSTKSKMEPKWLSLADDSTDKQAKNEIGKRQNIKYKRQSSYHWQVIQMTKKAKTEEETQEYLIQTASKVAVGSRGF